MKKIRALIDRGEKGAALLWVAGSLVVLLTTAAFATDLGWILLWNSRLQSAADAAALAGVVNLPGFLAQADADAEEAVAANGFPDALVVGEPQADNSYKVTLTSDVNTFFLRLIGFDTFTLSQTATAQYIKPVRLGSPDNKFGDPGTNFWAAINGQYTEIQQGDPYASRCTTIDDVADEPGCNGAENPDFREGGYYYGIEIAEGSSDLSLQIFDGGHYVSGNGRLANGTSQAGDRSWAWHWPDDMKGVNMEYRLYGPDSTPTNPTDNEDNAPLYCDETFPVNGANPDGHFNSYVGNHNCSVGGALTPGIWVLQLPAPLWEGATMFAIEATVSGPIQPKVYGILDMSVYVNFVNGSAEPYLAEIRPEHEGRTLLVDIWDLGDNDGQADIQILMPGGVGPSCSWTSSNSEPDGNSSICYIDISNRKYNNAWLHITIPLDGYTCDSTDPLGCWWKIHIETSATPDENGVAHDRTTWAASITGDPVRLTE